MGGVDEHVLACACVKMFIRMHMYSVVLHVHTCVCFLRALQCPSVNLNCHVETSTWHFRPLVLHGE